MIDTSRRIAYVIGAILLAVVVFQFLGGLVRLALLGALVVFALRAAAPHWFKGKVQEWANDLRQLRFWVENAFKPNRDAQATAAMAHQHQFLSGRMLSPINVFTVAPLILALVFACLSMFSMWRAHKAEEDRDAPCSDLELSVNGKGEYRTTRAACAALGATNAVAVQWRDQAKRLADEHQRDIDQVRAETASEIARLQAAAQRRQAASRQQGRRINEAIEAALGGAPPDLDRSLCELAGQVDCGVSDPGAGPSPAAPAIVPDGAGDGPIILNPAASEPAAGANG